VKEGRTVDGFGNFGNFDNSDNLGNYDDFEHELVRLMHRPGEPAPFEPRHREGIWTAVEKQRAARRRRAATGSVFAVLAVAVGAAVLPGAFGDRTGPAKVPSPATVGPTPPSSSTPSLPPTPSATSSVTAPSSLPSKTDLFGGLTSTSIVGGRTSNGGALPTTAPHSTTTTSQTGPNTSR
jgi:hypothetical protein